MVTAALAISATLGGLLLGASFMSPDTDAKGAALGLRGGVFAGIAAMLWLSIVC